MKKPICFCILGCFLYSGSGFSSNAIKIEVLRALRDACLYRHWIDQVWPELTFAEIETQSEASAYYDKFFTGHIYLNSTYLPFDTSTVVHEIWHAYWTLKGESPEFNFTFQVYKNFKDFESHVLSKGWDEFFGRHNYFFTLLGDTKEEVMVDELIGNALEHILQIADTISRLAPDETIAQVAWDWLKPASPSGSLINLSPAYLTKSYTNGLNFHLPVYMAKFLQQALLGFSDSVSDWPECFKGWQNDRKFIESLESNEFKPVLNEAFQKALLKSTSPTKMLDNYTYNVLKSYPPLREKWITAGKPIVKAKVLANRKSVNISPDMNTIELNPNLFISSANFVMNRSRFTFRQPIEKYIHFQLTEAFKKFN